MYKRLIIASFISIVMANSSTYAGCAGGGGGAAFTMPTTPEGIAKVINQLHPQPAARPQLTPGPVAVPIPPPVVAKVVWVKGTVKVMGPDKKIRTLQPDAPINLKDTIITDPGSQAEIVFSDHTIMTFREKTMFYVNKYEFHPEKKAATPSVGSYVMDLIEGGYRTVTGVIAKTNSNDYQVNTEVATMGVRGTDYSANFHACRIDMKRNAGTPILHNDKGTIVLSESKPYASVPAFNQAPVYLKQEPEIFKIPLTIKPATFTIKALSGDSGGGGSGKACAPVPGQFKVNFH